MGPDTKLQVSTSDPTPPYEQLRRQLVEMIISGRLEPSQRLPAVRQLAADLGLAAGTVARTYRELATEGLVITRRGGGTRVNTDLPVHPTSVLADDLQQQVTALVGQARRLGATDQQIREAVDTALDPANSASRNRHPAPDDPRPPASANRDSHSS